MCAHQKPALAQTDLHAPATLLIQGPHCPPPPHLAKSSLTISPPTNFATTSSHHPSMADVTTAMISPTGKDLSRCTRTQWQTHLYDYSWEQVDSVMVRSLAHARSSRGDSATATIMTTNHLHYHHHHPGRFVVHVAVPHTQSSASAATIGSGIGSSRYQGSYTKHCTECGHRLGSTGVCDPISVVMGRGEGRAGLDTTLFLVFLL